MKSKILAMGLFGFAGLLCGCATTPSLGVGYCLVTTQDACTETEGYPDCQPCPASRPMAAVARATSLMATTG